MIKRFVSPFQITKFTINHLPDMQKPYVFLSLILSLSLLLGCGKKSAVLGDETDPTKNPSNCTAKLADAENIQIFPADNPWNQDISTAIIDKNSTQIISNISTFSIKADFGSGLYDGKTIGISFLVACGSSSQLNPVTFRQNAYDGNYGSESDPGPYLIPTNAPIEGEGKGGDSHVIVVDATNKKLYELYNASLNNGKWEASAGAIFDLNSNALRPDGWTSADAAGLPIFPGLVRYEEILKGVIDHPIRFTLAKSNIQPAYVFPARHKVNSIGTVNGALAMGARIRLKADFDVSTYSPANQIILKAMKKYGLILADIGSNLYISGAPDNRWNNDDLALLNKVKGSNFEVVNFH
jgi:hypothetical protein